MTKDYLIGDFHIRMEGTPLLMATANIIGFNVFASEIIGTPQFYLIWTDDVPPEFSVELYQTEQGMICHRFGCYAQGYLFITGCLADNRQQLAVWVPKGGNRAYIHGHLDRYLLRFACWIAYGILTCQHRTVAIHSSVIAYRNQAVLFLGESGTGKSTHTRLWCKYIEGATLLNDDSPIVRIYGGIPYVYGSPWSGKTPCYKAERYELRGVVRLSQAPRNDIKKLNIIQSYAALHPSCPPDFAYDEKLYDYISVILNELLIKVPVYHLACLPNAEAAYLSCKTIYGL